MTLTRTLMRSRSRLLLGLLLCAASATTGAVSMALFTDSVSVASNDFSTSTVEISATPGSAFIGMSGMVPGDTVNASLQISNTGGARLRYAMTSSSTNTDAKGLRSVLTLTVRSEGTSCASFDGTLLYTGDLASAAFGSTAAGADLGDRSLNSGTSETLCFRVSLPSTVSSAYENATTTTTFTFSGEQTLNNP